MSVVLANTLNNLALLKNCIDFQPINLFDWINEEFDLFKRINEPSLKHSNFTLFFIISIIRFDTRE